MPEIIDIEETKAEAGTAITIKPETISTALAHFSEPDKIDPLIDEVEAIVNSFEPDLTTKKGRDAIASLAHRVSKTKVWLDGEGKKLNEDKRAQIEKVDAQRRRIKERLDKLRDKARKPLTDWEAAEAERKSSQESKLLSLTDDDTPFNTKALEERLIELSSFDIDAFDEDFIEQADAAMQTLKARLKTALESARKRDEEQAELERLRAAEIEREAADRARQEEADRKAEAERQRAAEEAEALAQAQRDKEAAEERQRAAEEAAERARADERRKIEAEQAEADRKAAEAAAEVERRQKDEEHRKKVKAAVVAALMPLLNGSEAAKTKTANALFDQMAKGAIPWVELRF